MLKNGFSFCKEVELFSKVSLTENVVVVTGYNTKMADWEMCLELRFFALE